LRRLEKYLVRELLVGVVGRLERLQEVQVEVPRRLRRGPLVGGSEEEVAPASDLVLPPLDLVLPDLVAPDVSLVGAFQDAGERVEVVLIELGVGKRVGLVLDLGVVVDRLLKVEVIPSPEISRAPVSRIVSIGQDRSGHGITPGA
jgi:hypothetical protein